MMNKLSAETNADMESQRLQSYIVLWSLYQILLDWNYGSLAHHGAYEYLQLGLLFLLLVVPTIIVNHTVKKTLTAVVVLARCAGLLVRMPNTFDSEYLQFWTDLTLAMAIVVDATEYLPEAMRWELGIFYSAAAFWKINSAFLNPKYSCATTYVVQLVCAFGLPVSLAQWLVPGFGVLTILIEGAIGVTAFSKRTAHVSVMLCLALHIGITLTPPPNNISGFGVVAIVRFLWLLPAHSVTSTLVPSSKAVMCYYYSAPVMAAAVFWELCARLHNEAPSVQWRTLSSFDWPAGVFGAAAAIVGIATFKGSGSSKQQEVDPVASPSSKPMRRLFIVGGGSCMVILWAFGTVVLGLLDGASPNMFSNLRMTGGSNHFLLPTGLLQHWFHEDNASVFGGGTLRVEATNSTLLNAIHPGEMTAVLSKETRQVLTQDLGYSGRFYNSLVANVVGTHVMPQYNERPKYTLPAFELHRVLRLNSEDNGPFEITVTKLEGPTGDEAWRRHSGDRTVKLVYSPFYPLIASCELVGHAAHDANKETGKPQSSECHDQDYFHLTFIAAEKSKTWLNWLGSTLQLWNSVVLYDDDDDTEIHCYGS